MRSGLRRVVLVGIGALLLGALAPIGLVGAQQASTPMLQVTPTSLSNGNITLHGFAVDCATGQPATRVALYDGVEPDAPYVADVSMDTSMDVGKACSGRSGSAMIGFTVIFDSAVLSDGVHSLVLVAEYPSGTTTMTSTQIATLNVPPYESQESSSD